MYLLAKKGPKEGSVVEIGSWKGKSTIALASGAKARNRAKVIAIDPHKGSRSWGKPVLKGPPTFTEFKRNIKKANLDDWVLPVVKTSKNASRSVRAGIRLLFIDGLHDYKSVLQDFRLWEPKVINGGIIAFHDAYCGYEGPQAVVFKECVKSKKFSGFGIVGSIIYARKIPALSLKAKLDTYRFRLLLPLVFALHRVKVRPSLEFAIFHILSRILFLNLFTIKIEMENRL